MQKRHRRVQIVIWQNQKVLLLKHRELITGNCFWALPGGGQEKGETNEETARREAWEETGLQIELMSEFYPAIPRLWNYYDEAVTVVARPVAGKLQCGKEPEPDTDFALVEARWFTLEEIASISFSLWQELTKILPI